VLLVERQEMPSDTLSTHVVWPDGLAALRRLGLLERVLASGAPPARHFRLCRGDDELLTGIIPFDGIGEVLCVRRVVLDGILWEAAANTPGVDVCDRTTTTGLRWDDGRVVGVNLHGPEGERGVSTALVIGADGRNSLVAREVGAVEEDVVPPGRYWYYGYFSDADLPGPVALTESDSERDTVVTMPTNDGLLMVGYAAYDEDFDEFRRDHADNYLARVRSHPWGARVLEGASLASPVLGMSGIRGYYRTPHGPGWVLVGDAVHQKDPIVARGLNEALRGAEWLTDSLRSGITDDALDRYAHTMRERTESKALNARMLMRPDRYMTPEQATILSAATSTPEGLAQYLRVEYDDAVHFNAFFSTNEASRGDPDGRESGE
jgi:2-polyprenyl-6-methoxyphenol hydroxylase-like FAD-dependent oxidoreductase